MATAFRTLALLPPPSPLGMDIDAMPFQLRVSIDGFIGLPEEKIALLERKLTEFFFQAPGRLNGHIAIYADMLGDIGSQARRIQIFLFSLRALLTPALNFTIEFDYRS
jgi:hypothetical protein